MVIAKQIFKVVLISILLLSVILIFRHPHKAFYDAKDEHFFHLAMPLIGLGPRLWGNYMRFKMGIQTGTKIN